MAIDRKEKSLKQREQLEGYLRDKYSKKMQEKIETVGKFKQIFDKEVE